MEIYKRILEYLANNDNGEFIEITHVDRNFDFLYSKVRELSKQGYVRIKSTAIYSFGDSNGNIKTYGDKDSANKIYAKILLAGHEYFKSLPKEQLLKIQISKAKKIEYIQSLITEVTSWRIFERSKVENFIIKAKDIISRIDGAESPYVLEIDIFNEPNLNNKVIIDDWDERLLSVLQRVKTKIDFEEMDEKNINSHKIIYVSLVRMDELVNLKCENFDLIKLIQLCKELNDAYVNQNYYSVGMLVRTIINHIPPIFQQQNFTSVVSQYKSDGNSKSFKESMEHLENSSRKIADSYVHSVARKQESLPTDVQVDFRQGLDVLLSEIVRTLK